MNFSPFRSLLAATGVLLASSSAHAVIYGGINFPDGAISFADSVVSYDPAFGGGAVPTAAYQITGSALGIPNYPAADSYVSLGAGGRIILQFTDNYLTGSNSSAPDLHIFEVGPDVEDTDVAISTDGVTWHEIGKVFGSTSSIDIDAFGFSSANLFSYVRLTDVKAEGAISGGTVGADIDAVGAITTIARSPQGVPDSGSTILLTAIAMVGLIGLRRRVRG